jgi:hypothetical protein
MYDTSFLDEALGFIDEDIDDTDDIDWTFDEDDDLEELDDFEEDFPEEM